jgi:hypothetical protein
MGKFDPGKGGEGSEGEYNYRFTLPLTSALDGPGGHRLTPAALPPEKRPGTHFIERVVIRRAGLDGYGKCNPRRDSIIGPPSS